MFSSVGLCSAHWKDQNYLDPLQMEQVEAADLVPLPPYRFSLHGCWEAGEGLVIREGSLFGDHFFLVSA